MSKLDTNHVVNLDLVKDRVNSVIKFGLADVETSDFFVGLYNNGSRVFDKDYIVTLYIVKPNGTFRNIKLEPIVGLKKYYCNLPDTLKNIPGEYVCQVMVFDNLTGEKKISKSKFKYSVSVDLASEMAGIIDEEEQESILTNVLNRLLTLENPVEPYATQKHVDECVSTLTEEIDTIKAKDVEQDGRLINIESKNTEQDNRLTSIESKNIEQDNRLTSIEAKDVEQDGRLNLLENQVDGIDEKIVNTIEPNLDNHGNRLDALEAKDIVHESRMTDIETKNTEQDNRLNSLESKDLGHESRLTNIESKNTEQDSRLDVAENRLANIGNDITNTMQPIIDGHTSRLDTIEAIDVAQNNRLDAIEAKNQQQDDRLLDIEKVNKQQAIDIKCLFTEAKNNMMDITEEANSIYLQNSTTGHVFIDEIKGNTLVNCNKEPDKELILNGDINTSGDNTVTITEGVDGGLVDVALEGNTLVNVSKTKDSTAITKAYTVENSGNHIALQSDIDGSCRPVITGNSLVNLLSHIKSATNINWKYEFPLNCIKENTAYTVIFELYDIVEDSAVSDILLSIENEANTPQIGVGFTEGVHIVKITTRNSTSNPALNLNRTVNLCCWIPANTTALYSIRNIIILEGDYTGKLIPDYFEELQSSFEDNLVTQEMVDSGEEVADNLGKYRIDYKVTGKNKFKLKDTPSSEVNETDLQIRLNNGGIILNGAVANGWNSVIIGSIKTSEKNKTYTLKYNQNKASATWHGFVGDTYLNGELVKSLAISHLGKGFEQGDLEFTITTPNDTDFDEIVLRYYISWDSNLPYTYDNFILSNIQIEEGTVATSYEPYKGNTKTLYLNSPLLKGDTIEEKDDGIYHVHRYKEVVLEGEETITHNGGQDSENHSCFTIRKDGLNSPDALCYVICDVLPSGWNAWDSIDNEGICIHPGNCIIFRINKAKLQTQDASGLKQWLQANPVTVVYELASPTYELIEQSDLVLPSYANGHLDFNTAVPVEKVDFLSFSEELTYLYANTQYTVQFMSDKATTADITLGGALLLSQSIVAGLNRIAITTPNELVDSKLIINRNGVGANISKVVVTNTNREFGYFEGMKSVGECEELQVISTNSDNSLSNKKTLTHEPLRAVGDAKDRYVLIGGKWYIERKCGIRAYQEGDEDNYKTDLINTVYPLEMLTYDEIDYNPLEVYSGTTHITTNSVIPTNITVKNHGFNCLLKPSTTYTISSNLGLNTVTTPSTLTEDCLRFMDTDTSDVTTMKDVLVLEGDWTTKTDLVPNNFSGIESCFEQELVTDENDEHYGKYKVNVKVANEDKSKENNITFYINEPLRGIGNVKDRVYVKDDKVVIERNCGVRAYEDGDFGTYITDKVNTVYQLLEPTYEEVEYNDTKLFIESFKNSTLSYNSNVPVTSKLYYSYSVPIVDKVAQATDISDQQDSMIIDLATQCAVMEIMLM